MADGDYERGRGRELSSLSAQLKRLAAERSAASPSVLVLNGWAASPRAWELCGFARERIYSYIDQLDGLPKKRIMSAAPGEKFLLVGWSMGGTSSMRIVCEFPERIAGLVLVASTPRMMEDRETGWRGMSPRRLAALEYGLKATHGEGFFGALEGKPNPYMMDTDENLTRGLDFLRATDLRAELERLRHRMPVRIFQSAHDGIVRHENAEYLHSVFPNSNLEMVPGTEHALPVIIPDRIDAAVSEILPRTPRNFCA